MKENTLQLQVESALLQNHLAEHSEIDVLNSNGIITLRGAVRSHEERDRAEEIVRQLPGVVNVINELDVI